MAHPISYICVCYIQQVQDLRSLTHCYRPFDVSIVELWGDGVRVYIRRGLYDALHSTGLRSGGCWVDSMPEAAVGSSQLLGPNSFSGPRLAVLLSV